MTSTTTDTGTGQRVYVRRRGYAQLVRIHAGDNSATVDYEPSSIHDGCSHPAADGTERVPFGDWMLDRTRDASPIDIKERIRLALQLDFGEEDFAVFGSGIGPGDASWFQAHYGPNVIVEVTVKPA